MSKNNQTAKLPPQAVDLESAVLGACILSHSDFLEVADFLKPEMFYKEANQKIYSAICSMSVAGDPVDLMTIVAKLQKIGELDSVGGPFYITELTDKVVNSVDIEFKARIVAEKYMQRQLINLSSQTIENCYDATVDIFHTLDQYEVKRDELINHVITKKEVSSDEAVRNLMLEMERRAALDDMDMTGVDTGFELMNKNTGGWQDSSLMILAARPAMGKTALMLKFVLEAARNGDHVAVFSLEMSTEKLMERMLSIMTDIPIERISKPKLLHDYEWQQIHSKAGELERLPITWDDSSDISMMEIGSKCKRWKRKKGLKFVVIDYLQLIKPMDRKVIREQQISQISRSLKILSKDLKCPVLALSQLSRECEKRPGNLKRPQLSDLRESGAIEQDADLVMFLFRPEYYGLAEDELGDSTAGKAEIIIAKNRSGQTDIVQVGFDGTKTKFYELEDSFSSGFDIIEPEKTIELPNNDMSRFNNFEPNFDDLGDEVINFNKKLRENNDLLNENDDGFPF